MYQKEMERKRLILLFLMALVPWLSLLTLGQGSQETDYSTLPTLVAFPESQSSKLVISNPNQPSTESLNVANLVVQEELTDSSISFANGETGMDAQQASLVANDSPNDSLVIGTGNQSPVIENSDNDLDGIGELVMPIQGNNLISPSEESLIIIPTEEAASNGGSLIVIPTEVTADVVSNREDDVVSTEAPAPMPAQYQSLLTRVQEEGRLPIIVRLNIRKQLEATLSDAGVQAQRQQIQFMQDQLLTALAPYHVTLVARFRSTPAIAIEVDEAALRFLVQSLLVVQMHEDTLDAPLLGQSIPIIGANLTQTVGFDGTGWAVAILDTGIDTDHTFYQNNGGTSRIVAEACFSNPQDSDEASLCPSGADSQTGVGSADPTARCSLLMVNCNHGSHVAGIAAGNLFNVPNGLRPTNPSSGVAPDAPIIAIQVFTSINDSSDCSPNAAPCILAYVSDQILALEHVLDLHDDGMNIAAVNMSLGGGGPFNSACDDDSRKDIIDDLRAEGIATVISSGNNGFNNGVGRPACISTAITVGSTDDGTGGAGTVDVVSGFSNSSSLVELLAPGDWINSSILGGGFGNMSGTSMAAPHVTGAWAVLKERNPSASVTDILNSLINTGVSVTDTDNNITKPRIQLDSALQTSSDLAITKTDSADPAIAGNLLDYIITVTNNGPDAALNVQVVDTLPAGVSFISVLSSPSTTTCSHSAGVVTCDAGVFFNGTIKTITITVRVEANVLDGTNISNTAAVDDLTGADPVAANNSSSQNTLIVARADLSVNKVDNIDPAVAGQDHIIYTITVNNFGPSDAQNAQVVDTLPLGVTFVSASGCVEAPVGAVTCPIGLLAANTQTIFTVEVSVDASTKGLITNTATVSSTTVDTNIPNNIETEDTEVVFVVDLEIVSMSIINPPAELIAGESAVVTLRTVIDNNGPSGPVDTMLSHTASAPPFGTVNPTSPSSLQAALGIDEMRVVDVDFTISCNRGLSKTFSFTSEIQSLDSADTDPNPSNNLGTLDLVVECVIPVEIDIRPHNPRNPVNPNSHGVLQVAIMSNAEFAFDATIVDPSTVLLAGAPVRLFQNDPDHFLTRDVNQDGLLDAVLRIDTDQLQLMQGDVIAVLIGQTFPTTVEGDPQPPAPIHFIGEDFVQIVPHGNSASSQAPIIIVGESPNNAPPVQAPVVLTTPSPEASPSPTQEIVAPPEATEDATNP